MCVQKAGSLVNLPNRMSKNHGFHIFLSKRGIHDIKLQLADDTIYHYSQKIELNVMTGKGKSYIVYYPHNYPPI